MFWRTHNVTNVVQVVASRGFGEGHSPFEATSSLSAIDHLAPKGDAGGSMGKSFLSVCQRGERRREQRSCLCKRRALHVEGLVKMSEGESWRAGGPCQGAMVVIYILKVPAIIHPSLPLGASIECIEGRMDANRAKPLPGGVASGGGRTGPLSQAQKMGIENGGSRKQVGLA